MLSETYKRNVAEVRKDDPNAFFIDVTRTSNSPLSPSWGMLNDYKKGNITWNTYVTRFREEMQSRGITNQLREIALLSQKKNVYLVCYEASGECHRFILLDMIEELAKKEGIDIEVVINTPRKKTH